VVEYVAAPRSWCCSPSRRPWSPGRSNGALSGPRPATRPPGRAGGSARALTPPSASAAARSPAAFARQRRACAARRRRIESSAAGVEVPPGRPRRPAQGIHHRRQQPHHSALRPARLRLHDNRTGHLRHSKCDLTSTAKDLWPAVPLAPIRVAQRWLPAVPEVTRCRRHQQQHDRGDAYHQKDNGRNKLRLRSRRSANLPSQRGRELTSGNGSAGAAHGGSGEHRPGSAPPTEG
jgi:hypothetical protein